MTDQQRSNRHWAAQPPEVRALRSVPPPERERRAYNLALAGFTIDPEIHAGIMDPVQAHHNRAASGIAWVRPLRPTDVTGIPTAQELLRGSGTPPDGSIATLSRVLEWTQAEVPDADPADGPTTVVVPGGFDDSAFDALVPNGKPLVVVVDWVGAPIENFPSFHYLTEAGIEAVQSQKITLWTKVHEEDGGKFIVMANMAANSLPTFYAVKVG